MKKQILEITQREYDVLEVMKKNPQSVLGGQSVRVYLPPSKIRDLLKEKYPQIKSYEVVASRDNLEHLGLIKKVPNERPKGTSGAVPPSVYELNQSLLDAAEFVFVAKRKSGYKKGTYKKPKITHDKTKATLRAARNLLEKKKKEIEKKSKRSAALLKRIKELKEDARVISELLALRESALKKRDCNCSQKKEE